MAAAGCHLLFPGDWCSYGLEDETSTSIKSASPVLRPDCVKARARSMYDDPIFARNTLKPSVAARANGRHSKVRSAIAHVFARQKDKMMIGTHAAPVHRPERLDSTVAHGRAHREAQPVPSFLSLRQFLQAFLTTQFRLLTRGVVAPCNSPVRAASVNR